MNEKQEQALRELLDSIDDSLVARLMEYYDMSYGIDAFGYTRDESILFFDTLLTVRELDEGISFEELLEEIYGNIMDLSE